MVYLNKKESEKIAKIILKTKNNKLVDIVKKIRFPQKRLTYVHNQPKIKELLRTAFKEKKKIKISYYSLSSDEVTNRVIDIYQFHEDCVIAYCNLRREERTFVIRRINKAALLDEKYKIPKNWSPESIILNK